MFMSLHWVMNLISCLLPVETNPIVMLEIFQFHASGILYWKKTQQVKEAIKQKKRISYGILPEGSDLVSFPDSVQGTESGAATAVGW